MTTISTTYTPFVFCSEFEPDPAKRTKALSYDLLETFKIVVFGFQAIFTCRYNYSLNCVIMGVVDGILRTLSKRVAFNS